MNFHSINARLLAAAAATLLVSGCASVLNDTTQAMRIDTLAADGTEVKGAECKISNDNGGWTVKSGEYSTVRRSSKDLNITCTDPKNPDAKARAISRANAGLAGNILLGGGIGAIIDHNRGTAYTYPTWVKLEFGKTLVFDRRNQPENAPALGTSEETTSAKAN